MEIDGHALAPPWNITLNYEYECRRRAFQMVREDNKCLTEALETVCASSELKELFFTTPIALGAKWQHKTDSTKGHPGQGGRNRNKGNKSQVKQTINKNKTEHKTDGNFKGKSKGKGSGKGGKGSKSKFTLAWKTPDGSDICFAFNSPEGCPGNCGRVHVCRVKNCYKDHTLMAHTE